MTDPIYEADGLVLRVVLPATAPILTGGVAAVHAKKFNAVALAGVAVISAPREITCTFAPWALEAGDWKVQVRVTPPANAVQTVGSYDLQVLPSVSPRPV